MEKEIRIDIMTTNYLLSDVIISPLGFNTRENLNAIRNSESALKLHHDPELFAEEFYAGLINIRDINEKFALLGDPAKFTKLEKLFILAISEVIQNSPQFSPENTGLVLSSTKGNIDVLDSEDFSKERVFLWKMAQVIADFFEFGQKPVIISNACISGGLAIKTASDLIEMGRFKNAVVAGGDLVSRFVLSGFQSFQAVSDRPCRPFSRDRQGISLGEAVAAVFIGEKEERDEDQIRYFDAVTANDANHISGPSRSGEGLFQSVSRLLKINNFKPLQIDYISAHGTATLYNDEMESIAFNRLGIEAIPINSFKGYFGHTLGTSALIESILTKHCLLNNELFASHNFTELGVSEKLNIIKHHREVNLNIALKTASGFGGCNLAMLLKKESR